MSDNERAKIAAYAIFNHPDGAVVLDDLKSAYSFEGNAFQVDKDGHYDPLSAMKRDAEHGVIKRIISRINQLNQYGTTKKTRVDKA